MRLPGGDSAVSGPRVRTLRYPRPAMATTATSADGIRWDLSDLCADADSARAEWDAFMTRAQAFADTHRGRIRELDAAGLRALLDELDALVEDVSRVGFYAMAREHTEATDAETQDLATISRDREADLENLLLFVDLEWLAVDDEAAEALLAAPELEPYAHKLRVARLEKPYVLGEPEEQALNARKPAVSAWQSLHGRQLATLEIEFDAGEGAEPHTIDRLLSYVHRPDRDLRRSALAALYEGLAGRADVQAACYDALVGDRLAVDRLRGIPDAMLPTNMRNELDGEVVEAMMCAVEEHYPLARRWFARKAELLGIDRLELSDQYAPLGEGRDVPWTEAVAIVDESLRGLEPRLGDVFQSCLELGHVDAEPRHGKIGGAYCNSVSRRVLPFVLLNYTDRLQDVVTLAHEFGHATHGALAYERQAYRSARSGIAVAEIPSTVAQLLAVEHLLDRETDPQTRMALLADEVEGALAAIFRQTVLARFEQRAYAARGEGKALTSDRLAGLWLEENERYYGDSLALPDGYRFGWSYIPHFIDVRFYTYAYAFAHLVAFTLVRRHREEPDSFGPAYLELLALGGSRSPQDLLEPVGVDLRDPATWADAFAEFEHVIAAASAAV